MALVQTHTTTVTFLHNYDQGDPLTATRNQSKTWRFSAFMKFIRALITGSTRNGATAVVGTAAASATVTLTSTGGAVNDTVTLNGAALTAKQHYAKGTVTLASVAAADTVTIGAVTYTFRVSPTLAHEVALGANDTAAAANLVAAVNADAVSSLVVFASSAAGVVTFRNVAVGTAGNSTVLLSSNGTRAAVTGSGTLTGATAPAADEWDMSGTLTQQSTSLAALFGTAGVAGTSTTANITGMVVASVAAGVTTLTALRKGLSGNAMTLAKSGSNIAVSGTRLSGGTETTYTF